MKTYYKPTEEVTLVFKNKEGDSVEVKTTVQEMLERTLDDFHESLEASCNETSCNTESQNFCDCGTVYEDYAIAEIKFPIHEPIY